MNKVAFLIAAHSDEENLRRLVGRLAPHPVFVHWDLKSGPSPEIEGAIFVANRKPVYWAGFSQVEATIELIRAAAKYEPDADVYAFLSGSCYPIRSTQEIYDYINNIEESLINCFTVEESPHLRNLLARRIWRDGIFPWRLHKYTLVQLTEKAVRKILNALLLPFPKKVPRDIVLYHGSNWWVLRKEIAHYVVNIFETRKDIVDFFRFTFASDESFFHSIIHSSEYSSRCSKPMKNVERGVYKTANIHLIDKSLSRTFKRGDFEEVVNSGKLFVRKVNTRQSTELLDELDLAAIELGHR